MKSRRQVESDGLDREAAGRGGGGTMNGADTAWMLMSTALVLLMTPALGVLLWRAGAFEERAQHHDDELRLAGLRRRGSGRCVGYSLAFAPGNDWIGDLSRAVLRRRGPRERTGTIPHVLFMAYQGTFCIITAALISGAIVERMRFSALRHVHRAVGAGRSTPRSRTGCGAAASWPRWARSTSRAAPSCTSTPAWRRCVAAMVLGPAHATTAARACCPTTCRSRVLGAGLLWFGWFGFNAGSALAASPIAGLAFTQRRCSRRRRRWSSGRCSTSCAPGKADRGRRRDRPSWSASWP